MSGRSGHVDLGAAGLQAAMLTGWPSLESIVYHIAASGLQAHLHPGHFCLGPRGSPVFLHLFSKKQASPTEPVQHHEGWLICVLCNLSGSGCRC